MGKEGVSGHRFFTNKENEAGDFTWFLFVEDTEGKTFVGLVDKYISFDAVLWMHEIGGRLMGEICGGKTVGFLSKEPVKRVLCNGEDVTAQVEKRIACICLS